MFPWQRIPTQQQGNCWKRCFLRGPCRNVNKRGNWSNCDTVWGGFEYLHRSPASRGRRRKGNPVPGGVTGPPFSWGYKYGNLVLQVGGVLHLRQQNRVMRPAGLGPEHACAGETNSNFKWQTHPLVREDVTWGLWLQGFRWKENAGRDAQGAWRQN
jgi:hypothetical protein